MSFRLPQNLSTQLGVETGASVLDKEILAEKAASLGRAGRLVEKSLAELRSFQGQACDRPRLVQRAAEAVYSYFVQRELCGFISNDDPIEHYAIPREVLARLGAKCADAPPPPHGGGGKSPLV